MMSIAGIVVGKLKKTETTMYVLDLWPENLFSVMNVKNRCLRNWRLAYRTGIIDTLNKLIVLSQTMKDRLVEITQIAPSKITVLPQACEKVYETDVYNKTLAERFKNKFNIVYAGNISRPSHSKQSSALPHC